MTYVRVLFIAHIRPLIVVYFQDVKKAHEVHTKRQKKHRPADVPPSTGTSQVAADVPPSTGTSQVAADVPPSTGTSQVAGALFYRVFDSS